MGKLYVGIDPDSIKSGVATWNTDKKELQLSNETFFDLFSLLNGMYKECPKVIIEGGWLNKSNWHLPSKCTNQLAATIGNKTGCNHETGRKIVEMCEHLDLAYEVIRPTNSKLNAETFRNITKYQGRTNPETRDAGMLVFGRK